jgi:hypothetical protein
MVLVPAQTVSMTRYTYTRLLPRPFQPSTDAAEDRNWIGTLLCSDHPIVGEPAQGPF